MLYAEMDKKRKERENLPITSLPVEMLAAQEPSLSSAVQDDQVWCAGVQLCPALDDDGFVSG